MTFNEIASIAGKGGLFHILKPTRSGVIVETLDDQRKKLVIGANQRVSILKEVSIYTTGGGEDSAPLEDIMQKIHEEFEGDPGVDTSDGEELKAFLKHVVPNYDAERVYVSDMKKLVNWYKILVTHAPEVLVKEEEKPEKTKDEKENDPKEEVNSEAVVTEQSEEKAEDDSIEAPKGSE